MLWLETLTQIFQPSFHCKLNPFVNGSCNSSISSFDPLFMESWIGVSPSMDYSSFWNYSNFSLLRRHSSPLGLIRQANEQEFHLCNHSLPLLEAYPSFCILGKNYNHVLCIGLSFFSILIWCFNWVFCVFSSRFECIFLDFGILRFLFLGCSWFQKS